MSGMAIVADMPKLRALWIPGKQTTAATLNALRPLHALEELVIIEPWEDLSYSTVFRGATRGIRDDSLEVLRSLRKLRHLEIPGASFTDPGLQSAELGKAWPELEVLNLSRSQTLSGTGLSTFEGHPKLRHLSLCDLPAFSDAGAAALPGIRNLTTVDLTGSGERVDLEALVSLTKLKHIKRLELGSWFAGKRVIDRHREVNALGDGPIGTPMFLDEEGELPVVWRELVVKIAKLPTLRYLGLDRAHLFTIADLEALCAAENLEVLDLTRSQRITSKSIQGMSRKAPFRIQHD